MSGRVVALAVNPENPAEFYVAYASGGVWHTTTNGINFDPISENAPTQHIGELAMHWPSENTLGRNWRKQCFTLVLCRDGNAKNNRQWSYMGSMPA